ncbi:MAG: L-histidine N(alpha)-methyltransferase, partial [Bacteroidota bacterium]
MTTSAKIINSDFAHDVAKGLSAQPKHLSSKYFYDERGDKLFQDIMHMPEYYLTDCEFEILDQHKANLLNLIGDQYFDLIELGAGDGLKTKILLEHFIQQKADFTYCPVDISGNVLELLENDLEQRWPALDLNPMQGDYFEMLERLHYRSDAKKVILFMGAN